MILASLAVAANTSLVATTLAGVTNGATPPASGVQAAATLTAAAIAAAAALIVALISVINTSRSLKQSRRDQWWQQFQWAIEKALSHDQDESDVGSAVMTQLVQRQEATPADNEIAVTVADLLTERDERTRKLLSRKKKPLREGTGSHE